MIFSIEYNIGRFPHSEIVECTTVGELSIAIELVMLEKELLRSQITVHEQ
jgi:hypothetical protein